VVRRQSQLCLALPLPSSRRLGVASADRGRKFSQCRRRRRRVKNRAISGQKYVNVCFSAGNRAKHHAVLESAATF